MTTILPFFLFFFTSECSWDQYVYEAEVISSYDADTTTLRVDLGFNVTIQERFRLYGINAWEVRGEEKDRGIPARDWFRSMIPDNHKVRIRTIRDKKGKFGRYLCQIYIPTALGWLHINDELVRQAHARYQEY